MSKTLHERKLEAAHDAYESELNKWQLDTHHYGQNVFIVRRRFESMIPGECDADQMKAWRFENEVIARFKLRDLILEAVIKAVEAVT